MQIPKCNAVLETLDEETQGIVTQLGGGRPWVCGCMEKIESVCDPGRKRSSRHLLTSVDLLADEGRHLLANHDASPSDACCDAVMAAPACATETVPAFIDEEIDITGIITECKARADAPKDAPKDAPTDAPKDAPTDEAKETPSTDDSGATKAAYGLGAALGFAALVL